MNRSYLNSDYVYQLLDLIWNEVEKSHIKNNEKHLLIETDNILQFFIIKCLSKKRIEKQYFFSCSCVDYKSTSNIKSVYEFILIISLAELLETWQQKFDDNINALNSKVRMILFVAYQSEKSHQINISKQINFFWCDNLIRKFLLKYD